MDSPIVNPPRFLDILQAFYDGYRTIIPNSLGPNIAATSAGLKAALKAAGAAHDAC